MLRVESNTKLEGFTEFEEDILFDEDDPDFDRTAPIAAMPEIFRRMREMSLAGVHPADIHSAHSSLTALNRSFDDLAQLTSEHVMTIEELKSQMCSCFSCGVSWSESHVSLDCPECGGYAMERPCPTCEGACGQKWKRDLSLSHASNKARWQGECAASRDRTSNQSDVDKVNINL